MSNFTEKDLALLSALIYSDFIIERMNREHTDTLGEAVSYMLENPDSWRGSRLTGDFGFLINEYRDSHGLEYARDRAQEQFTEMLQRVEGSGLENLRLVDHELRQPGDPVGITAAAFVDQNGNSVAVFRGTDGSAANWNENVQKARPNADPVSRQQALDFIDRLQAEGLTDITVTGHSKGGNLAMCVAIRHEAVLAAVAFSAPGFSDSFIREHRDLIAANRDSITRIDSYGDFIPAMLNCVAGERVFVGNEGENFKRQHFISNIILYTDNIDSDGNFVRGREQSQAAQTFEGIANRALRNMPPGMEDMFLSLVGPIAGFFLGSEDRSFNDALNAVLSGLILIKSPKLILAALIATICAAIEYAVVRFATWAFDQIVNFVVNAIDVISGAVESFGQWAVDFLTDIGNGLRDLGSSFLNWLSGNGNSGGSTGDFMLKFDQIDIASRNFRNISNDLNDSSSSLRAVASLLSGQSGFGISGIQRSINNLARDLERLGDDVSSISQFTTTLSETTQRYENLAFNELSGLNAV